LPDIKPIDADSRATHSAWVLGLQETSTHAEKVHHDYDKHGEALLKAISKILKQKVTVTGSRSSEPAGVTNAARLVGTLPVLDDARLGNLQVRLHGRGSHGEEAQGPAWDCPRGGGLTADVGRLLVGLARAE
jgi:hypothetical protein